MEQGAGVMIAVAIALGLVLGYLLAAGVSPAKRRTKEKPRPVRLGATNLSARPLSDVIEATRAAALRVVSRADGFDLVDHPASSDTSERLAVRVSDPSAVTISSLRCEDTTSFHLPFELALALVPLYGSLTLVAEGEVYEVDGTKDIHALIRELSRRQTARVRELVARQANRS